MPATDNPAHEHSQNNQNQNRPAARRKRFPNRLRLHRADSDQTAPPVSAASATTRLFITSDPAFPWSQNPQLLRSRSLKSGNACSSFPATSESPIRVIAGRTTHRARKLRQAHQPRAHQNNARNRRKIQQIIQQHRPQQKPRPDATRIPTPYITLNSRTRRRSDSRVSISAVGGITKLQPAFRRRRGTRGASPIQHPLNQPHHLTHNPFYRDQHHKNDHHQRRVPKRLGGIHRE